MAVYTTEQLNAMGIGRGAIAYRMRVGTLVRLLPTVYSTSAPTYLDRCRAAALWKPDAILSHSTALWLWRFVDAEPDTVEVTVPLGVRTRSPDWVVMHRRTLEELSVLERMRVVTIEQCLVDAAVVLSTPKLEKLFDAAIDRRLGWREFAIACEKSAGMAGMAAVREQSRRCCPMTRSEPERIVARALTARNFRLEINGRVGRYYGDLVDRKARVIVEIDGREFHSDPETFDNDRSRQNNMLLDGWFVLRYSVATVMAHLDEVVDQIIRVVRRRRKARS